MTEAALSSANASLPPRAARSQLVAVEPPGRALSSLHVGMGWHEEQPGGLNRMVANLLLHLPAANVAAQGLVAGSARVEQLSCGRATAFAGIDERMPVRMWRARRAIRDAARRDRPDVIALHFAAHFALFGRDADRLGGAIPIVVHFHGPWAGEGVIEGNSRLVWFGKRWIEGRAYRAASRLIVLSEAFAKVLEHDYGIDRRLVRVVPGGVDTERFDTTPSRPDARAALGLPTDRPIVLAVRRLARRMGLPGLVAAFATVKNRVPEALLVIAGDGPLRRELEDQVQDSGLTGHVRLLGHIAEDRLPLLYRAADLSVVPSTTLEGFGLTCIELLASGTPALVAPVGGLPEVVRDLSPSLILASLDDRTMADAISSILRGQRATPLAEDCAAYVKARFAWPVIARQVRSVYAEAVA